MDCYCSKHSVLVITLSYIVLAACILFGLVFLFGGGGERGGNRHLGTEKLPSTGVRKLSYSVSRALYLVSLFPIC
jgi:fructose-bisphosphate aldolase class 1